jgi:hypothetical protein
MFAAPLAAEMAAGGTLGFPDLEILQTAEQVLIGSPQLLAIEYGTFSHEKLRDQASKKNFSRRLVKNSELWVSPEPNALSVAYISEKVLLVGKVSTLESEIARVADPKSRSYSPLLARGARYIKEDLWVVAARLPDPLASSFIPFDWEATAFEGSVSVWDGLHAVAAVERSTPTRAMDLADTIAMSLASRPAMAEGTEITTRDRSVLIRMDLDDDQLAASMRQEPDAPVVAAETIYAAPPAPVASASTVSKTFTPKPVAVKSAPASRPVSVPPVPAISAPVTPVSVAVVPGIAVPAPVKPQPRTFVTPASPAPIAQPKETAAIALPDVDVRSDIALKADSSTPTSALPPKPRVIRIVGLDDGPREILIDKAAR